MVTVTFVVVRDRLQIRQIQYAAFLATLVQHAWLIVGSVPASTDKARDDDAAQRSLRARMAAYTMHASHHARVTTRNAREAFLATFERRVDPPATYEVASYHGPMSVVEHPERGHLRSFTVDDDRLSTALPILSAEEFALDDVTDEEWDAFHAAIADA